VEDVAARRRKTPPAPVPFWKKPVGWLAGVGGLVVSALVAFLVPQLAPGLADTAKDVAGAAVLGVTVEDDQSGPAGDSWSTATETGPPPLDDEGRWSVYPPDWFREKGALRAGVSGHRVVVENRRSGAVELLDIRPVIVERRDPFAGALYWRPAQGEVADVSLRVDLDEAGPVVRDRKSGEPYFATRHQQLAKGERVVFRIVAETVRCLCAWRLTADYHDADGTHTLTIPAQDRPPLQTTAFAASYTTVYDGLQTGYPAVDPATFCRSPGSPCRR
jgi:hypothetical protein